MSTNITTQAVFALSVETRDDAVSHLKLAVNAQGEMLAQVKQAASIVCGGKLADQTQFAATRAYIGTSLKPELDRLAKESGRDIGTIREYFSACVDIILAGAQIASVKSLATAGEQPVILTLTEAGNQDIKAEAKRIREDKGIAKARAPNHTAKPVVDKPVVDKPVVEDKPLPSLASVLDPIFMDYPIAEWVGYFAKRGYAVKETVLNTPAKPTGTTQDALKAVGNGNVPTKGNQRVNS